MILANMVDLSDEPPLEVHSECRDDRWQESWPRWREDLEALCFAALAAESEHCRPSAVSIILADDAFITELNAQYRGKLNPTNVLSFPAGEEWELPGEPRMLGDIVMAYETIAREAEEQHKTIPHHAAHMVVHGMLHLLGHDHQNDIEAERMEHLEIAVLDRFGIANPYLSTASE